MLHNYNSYTLILEGKARDKKISKMKKKIQKFANIPGIYDWSVEKCITDRSLEGLQYSVWVANYLKTVIVDGIIDSETDAKEELGLEKDKIITKERIEKWIKTGNDKELEKRISKNWGDINSLIEGFQESINEDLNYVLDWLKNPLREEKVNLSKLTFKEAYTKSDEWHKSLKASGKIEDENGEVFIEFDDGFYWIDLETTYSKDEAEAMGHCGNTNDGDTLFSLRDSKKSPHVTVAYDSSDGAIYQMKGRQNKKPVEKYYKYIYRLLVDPVLKPKYFAYEYLKEEDFNRSDFDKETFKKVFDYNPNIVYGSIQHDTKMCRDLVKKGYLDKDEIKDVLFNSEDVKDKIFLDFLDVEEFLFTYKELKEIYDSLDFKFSDFGELPPLMLYDKGLINKKVFSDQFVDVVVGEDGELYVEMDEDDLEPHMSSYAHDLVFGDMDYDGGWYDLERCEDVWDDLTKETKTDVITKMIDKEITYDWWRESNEDRKFHEIRITKEMIKWEDINNRKNGGEYYFYYNNEKYEIYIIIDENKDGDLEELYNAFNRAINDAQQDAQQDAYHNAAHNAIEEELCGFVKDGRSVKKPDGDTHYYDVLVFKFNDLVKLDDIISELKSEYSWNGELDYEEESYGNLVGIRLETASQISISDNVYSTIDSSSLNERLSEALYEIK